MTGTSLPDIQERIGECKNQAINKLVTYFAVLTFLAYPISISRMLTIGWQHSMTVHTLILPLVLVMYFCRRQFTYKEKASFYIGLGLIGSAVQIYDFGLTGSGLLIGLNSLLIALFYLDKKSTYLTIFIALLLYSFSAYAFIWESRVMMENSISSLSLLGVSALCTVLFGVTTFDMLKQMTNLLIETDRTNKLIESQKQEIEDLVNHDSLTGLLSLRAAENQLTRVLELAKQEKHNSALLFLDLDGFKGVNDAHGHNTGDRVLQTIADRIKSTIRTTDLACRVGGDEFLVIVGKVESESDTKHLCERLIQSISEPVQYGGKEVVVGASIGVAVYPDCAIDGPGLREKADRLMYQVKRTGKNNYLTENMINLRGI